MSFAGSPAPARSAPTRAAAGPTAWAPAGPRPAPPPAARRPATGYAPAGYPPPGPPAAPAGRPAAPPGPRNRPVAESYPAPESDAAPDPAVGERTGALATAPPPAAPSPAAPPPAAPSPAGTSSAPDFYGFEDAGSGGPRTAVAPAGLDRADPDDWAADDDWGTDDGWVADGADVEDDDWESEVEPPRPTVREWAVVGVQLVLGALLGAVLWLAFSWLWRSQPLVALVLALAATTGLVFGVRAMRRSEDLKTTVLAVVVGLVVTVSPAAFVLLAR